MGEPIAGVVRHSVPLKSARVRIALLQLAGPTPIGKETRVINGRPTLRWKPALVANRTARTQALVEALSRCEPRPDIIIFPEYTTPLTAEAISGLQPIADRNDIIIIPGADNETPRSAQGRQRITQSVVIIPRAEPVYVEKRKLSVWELEKGRVDEPTNPRLHAFEWKVSDARYWFSVQVCLDFLHFAADPPKDFLEVPGLVLCPMCSPKMDNFHVYADSLRPRLLRGVASVLCNCTGGSMCGSSRVVLTTVEKPEKGKLHTPIALSGDREECAVVEIDMDHLVLPHAKSKDTRVALGVTNYYDILGAELTERNETHPPGWGVLAYHNADLIHRFGREEWPYDLDKNQFVRAVEYVVGDLKCRERPIDDRDCLMHLKSEAGNRPLAIVGYYGMGKTTLMKMLFASLAENWTDTVPIFLSLSNLHLRDVGRRQLGGTLAQVIASNRGAAVAADARQVETIQRTIDELIDSRKLLILFDGIDEALTDDREELVTFLQQLHQFGLRYVLTCRLEYSPFFDVGRQVFPAGHPAVVELRDWGPKQWALYVNALREELPEQRHLVDTFAARLESGHYANLPARPLFLRMLADLETRNDTDINIDERLSGNLSEVYFKFISWKVMDDYKRKGGVRFDGVTFQLEAFDLLSQLATVQYKRGRTGQEGAIRLGDVNKILVLGEFHELKDHVIRSLLHSSLFSILRRSDENAFRFSHKSFMEYLVAHLYAATIFASPGDPSRSTCTGVWGEYQTHEVSQHFLQEVDRIRVSKNLTEARVLDHFREAFVAALRDDASADPNVLDERIQSVLYYAGRLRLRDNRIQSKLHSVLANPDSHHKIYRRSASIALAILESPKYIDEYALFLLNHRSERGSDFDLNLSISKEYYGVPGVERVLREDLKKFLSGAERNPILSLRLLTYCAYMAEVNPSSGLEVRKIVDAVLTEARRHELEGLERVCARILESWPTEEP